MNIFTDQHDDFEAFVGIYEEAFRQLPFLFLIIFITSICLQDFRTLLFQLLTILLGLESRWNFEFLRVHMRISASGTIICYTCLYEKIVVYNSFIKYENGSLKEIQRVMPTIEFELS